MTEKTERLVVSYIYICREKKTSKKLEREKGEEKQVQTYIRERERGKNSHTPLSFLHPSMHASTHRQKRNKHTRRKEEVITKEEKGKGANTHTHTHTHLA